MSQHDEPISRAGTQPRKMLEPNTAKSAELQIIIWFLEAGWELFTPVADLYGTDIVVRHPVTRDLIAIQVKHKQPGSLNEGELQRTWDEHEPSFDYLIFFVPARKRGLVIPRQKLKKSGKMFIFYSRDEEGYARGAVRPLFKEYAFEFGGIALESRAIAFVDFFSKVHAQSQSEDPAPYSRSL
jgi:hypothetical protein